MCSVKSIVSASVVLLCVFGFAGMLHADYSHSYGDLSGINVVYQNITESTETDDKALFGTPSVSADSLVFSPGSFSASATGAGGIDLTDGQLGTTIMAVQDRRIEMIRFAESGDYSLYGVGTASTAVQVGAILHVRVEEVEGLAINPVTFSTEMSFNPSDGTYNLIDDPGLAKGWNGGVEFDVTAALDLMGFGGKATKVYMTLDNTLAAMSEAGTSAYIKKKDLGGVTLTTVVDNVIPEPSSLLLLVLGALSLFVGRGTHRW
ncbi:MAG: PEP-CTERM sorting domain-containing protein [Pirellulaceae bacterium]|nr:PEP-CTERM sorting domain-containing protein [Pirellulaceae bacterium]